MLDSDLIFENRWEKFLRSLKLSFVHSGNRINMTLIYVPTSNLFPFWLQTSKPTRINHSVWMFVIGLSFKKGQKIRHMHVFCILSWCLWHLSGTYRQNNNPEPGYIYPEDLSLQQKMCPSNTLHFLIMVPEDNAVLGTGIKLGTRSYILNVKVTVQMEYK